MRTENECARIFSFFFFVTVVYFGFLRHRRYTAIATTTFANTFRAGRGRGWRKEKYGREKYYIHKNSCTILYISSVLWQDGIRHFICNNKIQSWLERVQRARMNVDWRRGQRANDAEKTKENMAQAFSILIRHDAVVCRARQPTSRSQTSSRAQTHHKFRAAE